MSLTGWLPKNSYVMTKRKLPQATSALVRSPLIFVNAYSNDYGHLTGEVGALFDKMLEAMGFARAQVKILDVKMNATMDFNAAELALTLKEIQELNPKVVVTLGEEIRGKINVPTGIKLIAIDHPEELFRKPALKKQAWEELKGAISILKS